MEKRVLYIDDREPLHLPELIAEYCSIPIKIKRLTTGDYVCEDIVIERKGSLNDFATSLMSSKDKVGRLWSQASRMKKDYLYKYILVSGSWNELTVGIHPHAIWGAVARLLFDGFSIVFGLRDDNDLVYLLLKIFEKHRKLWLVPPKKPKKRKRKKKKKTEVFVGFVK